MPRDLIMKLLMTSGFISFVSCVLSENKNDEKTTLVIGDPPPDQSTHRLISAIIDPLDNSSQSFSPGNITDTTPFIPSGVVQVHRSAEQLSEPSPKSGNKDFTPSYFMGEVIPEPYVPERFQSPKISKSGLVSSQTISFPKLLPRDEQKKKNIPSYGRSPEEQYDSKHPLGPYFQDHVSPVHEQSPVGEDSTTPKYSPQYQESDQLSNPPIDIPYRFEKGPHNIQSTKPVTFDDGQSKHQKPFSVDFDENQGYFHPYKYKVNAENFDEPFTSQPDYYKHYSGLKDDGRNSNNGYHNIFSGLKDRKIPLYNSYPHNEDYMKPRPEVDLVLPSPFYPPELNHPSSYQKGVQYKVHQHKPKSALHGLLHFAAALLPLGLFVAALQPNVLYVNSSQDAEEGLVRGIRRFLDLSGLLTPMPSKGRSVENLESLQTRGLEVLARLERGDCERRAFCELAVLGARSDGSAAQRGLWTLANSLAEDGTSSATLARVMAAVKSKSCSVLKCDGLPPHNRRR